jgi:hypothetical protein
VRAAASVLVAAFATTSTGAPAGQRPERRRDQEHIGPSWTCWPRRPAPAPWGPIPCPAIERLRVRRLGDTLLFLTGPPNETDLGEVAGLRGAYPSIIAGVFGPVESGLATTAGLLVVGAVDGPDFAAAWDGVATW